MTDNTWIRSYGGKNVYSDSEIRANRMSTEGDINVNGGVRTSSLNICRPGQDCNKGISLYTNDQDGAGYDNYQGGIESWWGIGFRSRIDGQTRFMHNTRNGDTSIRGNYYNNSDINDKKNINPLSQEEINNVSKLQPVSYKFKDDENSKDHYGFIAQQVEETYPRLVLTSNTGKKLLNYQGITPLLTGKLNKLNPKSDTLCLDDVCVSKEDLKKIKKIVS